VPVKISKNLIAKETSWKEANELVAKFAAKNFAGVKTRDRPRRNVGAAVVAAAKLSKKWKEDALIAVGRNGFAISAESRGASDIDFAGNYIRVTPEGKVFKIKVDYKSIKEDISLLSVPNDLLNAAKEVLANN